MTVTLVTECLLIFVVSLLTIYDVWVIRRFGHEPSISVVLYEASTRNPIIPLLIGIAIGHVFWPLLPKG